MKTKPRSFWGFFLKRWAVSLVISAAQVPPAVLWPWVPLSTGAVLTESLPPWGWLKVLGAWEGCSASPAP